MIKVLLQVRLTELVYSLCTYIPVINRIVRKGTGGTDLPTYCYSVWLRHMVMAQSCSLNTNPQVVAELGPGDSLGIGLAALIFGAEKYYAFDVVAFADIKNNLKIFDALVSLAKERKDIPNETDFPEVKPYLDSYAFPDDIYTVERLSICLAPKRLNRIRGSILNPEGDDSVIQYIVPWFSESVMEKSSVDLIFSQAVLEHVDALKNTYETMFNWLKSDGYMSHQIDFKCHGTSKSWNGHWLYPELLWKLIRGKRAYLLNRVPYSTHGKMLADSGFSLVKEKKIAMGSLIRLQDVDKKFKTLSSEDLHTSGAYILAVK